MINLEAIYSWPLIENQKSGLPPSLAEIQVALWADIPATLLLLYKIKNF